MYHPPPSSSYTLSLHDALPILQTTMVWWLGLCGVSLLNVAVWLVAASVDLPATHYRFWQLVLSGVYVAGCAFRSLFPRSEEHTSELQSLRHLVCRLLLEKKK